MINLICFPHYTCGGLISDIINDTYSEVGSNGGINSITHHMGKIGDADTVFVDYNPDDFYAATCNFPDGTWVGTHCWPGPLPCELYGHIINITTATSRSRIYRWIRSYYHYFSKSEPFKEVSGTALVDKMRETAKNYLQPFEPVYKPNVINLEFADVVENTQEFRAALAGYATEKHIDRWQKINDFLYGNDLWNSEITKAYYQAEFEVALNRYYIYQ